MGRGDREGRRGEGRGEKGIEGEGREKQYEPRMLLLFTFFAIKRYSVRTF